MRNYLRLGPISVKVSSKGLANWGYPRIHIGGLSLFSRSNDGIFMPAAYHPRSSLTWLWSTMLYRGKPSREWDGRVRGSRSFALPFGWVLRYSWQQRMPRHPAHPNCRCIQINPKESN